MCKFKVKVGAENMGPGHIFSSLTLTLHLLFSLPFHIAPKGKVKLKWSGEYGSWLTLDS